MRAEKQKTITKAERDQLRINYACDLLRSGLYTVSHTAERCGFESVAFFSRQFKAYMGVSPSAYVREMRQEKASGQPKT